MKHLLIQSKTILKFEMMKDESLFEIFMEEIQEVGFKVIADYINKQVQESEKWMQ